MQTSWKLRLVLAILLLGLAAYFLIPSWIYFSLPEADLREVRRDKNAFAQYVPSWAPESHIVPGLDLQGGIHMVLGIDLQKAIFDKTGRIADRLRSFAKSEDVLFESIEHIGKPGEKNRIEVRFASKEDKKRFKKKILDRFGEVTIAYDSGELLSLKLDLNIVKTIRKDAVDQTINTIRNRIDKMGVTEPSIAKRGDDQIQIQLPGYDNPEEARSLIGRTAQLEFRMCDDETDFLLKLTDLPDDVELVKTGYSRPDGTAGNDFYLTFPEQKLSIVKSYIADKTPDGRVIKYGKLAERLGEIPMMRTYTVFKKVELTGDDLVDTRVTMGTDTNPRPSVSVTFNPTGARIFDELTKVSIGKRMAIVLEDLVDSAPVINTRIPDGNASISMGGARTREEMLRDANQLSLVLKAGALPAPVTFREERSVGPSLGADTVRQGRIAFMVGGIFVVAFMLFYYHLAGIISILGLIFNISFVLATLSALGATITLPGVAGLLLTIGMAVDANIIINERIREELRLGKMPRSAVRSGYEAAFSAVMDANVTTFIAALVLWQYGTGPVQNFAMMLLIGTVSSVISAVFITRIFFDTLTARGPQTISI